MEMAAQHGSPPQGPTTPAPRNFFLASTLNPSRQASGSSCRSSVPLPPAHLRLPDGGSFRSQRVGKGDGVEDDSALVSILFLLPWMEHDI